MKAYPLEDLGSVLSKSEDLVKIEPDQEYATAGILNRGRGLFKRPTILGSETQYVKYNRLRTGRLVYSKLFAWEGALAVVPPGFDGLHVSHEFPTFDIIDERADPRFIGHLVTWPALHEALSKQTSGMGSRRQRVNIDQLLSAKVPLPDLDEQRRIADRLDATLGRVTSAVALRDRASEIRSSLRQSLLAQASANTDEVAVVGDILTLIRRPVSVSSSEVYREIGLRSFGRGVFHKPPVSGEEIGNKKVFYIEPGDLIFSNIFAWEGAVALASDSEQGYIGSHRFMTYQVNAEIANPEYLLHFFSVGPGLDAIRAASPGSAGRNKTLGIKTFAAQTVPLPPLDEQNHLARQLNRVAGAADAATAQSQELAAIRISLLNAAFTGQL